MLSQTKGFTLIELLVVVTIIVVLLALLTPALDKAIYQAELSVCGAGKRAIATAATSYAMDHGRAYPYRHVEDPGAGEWRPETMQANDLDERLQVRPYIGINAFNDPLTGKIDLSGEQPDTYIASPVAIWYGWRYKSAYHTDPGMRRLGDRFAWSDPFGTKVTYRFDLLASDLDLIDVRDGLGWGTHPESEGRWSPDVQQSISAVGLGSDTRVTYSRWGYVPSNRGTVDTNYAHADGSVERFDAVTWDEPDRSDRMARVPISFNYPVAGPAEYWINLSPK